jgi:O-antigen/teichoic acid export membrane protein
MNKLGKLTVLTVFNQIVLILINPILAMFYTTHELGEFRFYYSILGFIAIFCTLSFDRLIYKLSYERKLTSIGSILYFSLFISLLLVLYCVVYENYYALLMSIAIVPFTLFNILIAFYASEDRFKDIYKSKLIDTTLNPLVKVSFAFLRFDSMLLFIGEFVSKLIVSIRFFSVYSETSKKGVYSFYNVYELICSNVNYLKFVYPGILINAFSLLLPVLVLKYNYSYSEVGLYALAMSIVQAPAGLINTNLSTIIQSEFKKQNVLDSFSGLFIKLACVYALYPLFIYLNAPIVIGSLFSNEWSGLIDIMLPFAILTVFIGISNPFSVYFHLLGKEKVLLKFQIFKFFFRLVLLLLLPHYFNFNEFVFIFCLINVVIQSLQLILTAKCVGFLFLVFLRVNAKKLIEIFLVFTMLCLVVNFYTQLNFILINLIIVLYTIRGGVQLVFNK